MMDGGYHGSKYSEDMFISPPSHCGSNISVCHDQPDYKVDYKVPPLTGLHCLTFMFQYLGRSLSHESDRGYNSYTTGDHTGLVWPPPTSILFQGPAVSTEH